MTDSVYWIWFQTMFGIGTRRAELFLSYFENPRDIYDGSADSGGRVWGMLSEKERTAREPAMEQAVNLRRRTLQKGCEVVTPDHPAYPPLLRQIYSRPAALYVKGDISCLQESLCIAMVGTRNHTDYGKKAAVMLAGGLAAAGVTVVSGLAKGIDTFCHEAALNHGGKTVGILGCGLDVDYPKGNAPLKTAMVKAGGAVLSEYPMGSQPRPGNFPVRNRIISGVCQGTVVVEADRKSGSILTANHALEQGRTVFAVPGSIFSAREQGTHALIRDGAALVEGVDDILCEFGLRAKEEGSLPGEENPVPETAPTVAVKLPEALSDQAGTLYGLLESPRTVDDLAGSSHMEVGDLHAALTELELYGLIRAMPGRLFARSGGEPPCDMQRT